MGARLSGSGALCMLTHLTLTPSSIEQSPAAMPVHCDRGLKHQQDGTWPPMVCSMVVCQRKPLLQQGWWVRLKIRTANQDIKVTDVDPHHRLSTHLMLLPAMRQATEPNSHPNVPHGPASACHPAARRVIH